MQINTFVFREMSLVWEIPRFKIAEFRVAEEHEMGVDSLNLTIE